VHAFVYYFCSIFVTNSISMFYSRCDWLWGVAEPSVRLPVRPGQYDPHAAAPSLWLIHQDVLSSRTFTHNHLFWRTKIATMAFVVFALFLTLKLKKTIRIWSKLSYRSDPLVWSWATAWQCSVSVWNLSFYQKKFEGKRIRATFLLLKTDFNWWHHSDDKCIIYRYRYHSWNWQENIFFM